MAEDIDPFEGGTKTEALSWKDQPVGTEYVLRTLGPAKLLQQRNYETNELDYWPPNPDGTANPKMAAVVNVTVLSGPMGVGEERSIWAGKPSSMFSAIAAAQKEAGVRIAAGGTLTLRYADDSRNAQGQPAHPTNPRYSPIKQYVATYQPGDAFAGATSQPAAQPAPTTPAGANVPVHDDEAPF